MRPTLLLSAVLLVVLSGCSGGSGMRCEDPERYAGSREMPPVRVPDDLSVPDEAQALRIPQVARSSPSLQQPDAGARCLESPPAYSDSVTGQDAPDASPGTTGTQ